MDSEWIDARIDGSDLRVGDRVRFTHQEWSGIPRVVIRLDDSDVLVTGPRYERRNRSDLSFRWQYHAPTRAKLEAAERAALFATETTYLIPTSTSRAKPIGEAEQLAPPPDSEPGWDHVPVEWIEVGVLSTTYPGDRYRIEDRDWCTATFKSKGATYGIGHWIRRAAHPERVRWLEEQRRNAIKAGARVLGTAIVSRDDAVTSYSSAAVNTDQLRYKAGPDARTIRVTVGTALVSRDDAHEAVRDADAQAPVARSVECLSCGTWRTSSFPVCACGETRTLAECSGFRGGIQTPDDVNALVRKIAASSTPLDPFAAVRAEAKRMLDHGANPRVVLGALDRCVMHGDPSAWTVELTHALVRELARSAADCPRSTAAAPCYHGNRAGTCGWCALSRDRSDARAVVSHEPAWETADCEGE